MHNEIVVSPCSRPSLSLNNIILDTICAIERPLCHVSRLAIVPMPLFFYIKRIRSSSVFSTYFIKRPNYIFLVAPSCNIFYNVNMVFCNMLLPVVVKCAKKRNQGHTSISWRSGVYYLTLPFIIITHIAFFFKSTKWSWAFSCTTIIIPSICDYLQKLIMYFLMVIRLFKYILRIWHYTISYYKKITHFLWYMVLFNQSKRTNLKLHACGSGKERHTYK